MTNMKEDTTQKKPGNRRTSERRAELAPAIPSEEEEGEARGGGSRKAITGSMR